MSTTYMNDATTPTRGAYDVPTTGRARFSSLDITAFIVACAMLLIPLAMAAYGTWTLPPGV